MEDWVERLHQWGMHQRRRFQTVQDPFVRALAGEMATSRNKHPNVIAQVEQRTPGTRENWQIKRLMFYQTDENCSAMWGGSRGSNISLEGSGWRRGL